MKVYRINKFYMMFGVWFSVFAVIMAVIGAGMLISWADFRRNSLSTDAVITNIRERYNYNSESTEHDVTIEYTVNGVLYTRSLGYYSSGMKKGQTVTINYDPEDPDHIMSAPYFACAILGLFVLIFGGVGAGFVIFEMKKMNTINRLASENKYIICDQTCERDEVRANIRVNNVYYRQTNFIYRDQYGREYVFSSSAYPPGKCPFAPWQSVKVYVDIENDPKKYYVCADDEHYDGDNERYPDNYDNYYKY